MRSLQLLSDKLAIGISSLCIAHCLAVPAIAIVIPTIIPDDLAHFSFHLWVLFAVMPISLFALLSGYKKHQSQQVIVLGFAGLAILVFAAFFAEGTFGEFTEKMFTVAGSISIAIAHLRNFKYCRISGKHTCANTKEH